MLRREESRPEAGCDVTTSRGLRGWCGRRERSEDGEQLAFRLEFAEGSSGT